MMYTVQFMIWSSRNLTGNLTVRLLEVHFVGVCEALLSLVEPEASDSALLAAAGGVTATVGATATGDVTGSS